MVKTDVAIILTKIVKQSYIVDLLIPTTSSEVVHSSHNSKVKKCLSTKVSVNLTLDQFRSIIWHLRERES